MQAEILTRFAVTLRFADGEYKGTATAPDKAAALHLAVVDARMGSPFNSFFGKLLEQHATPI
jgi:hypothetical protein